MEYRTRSLSADGTWMWDGTGWVSAYSPDRFWRWNGRRWVPAGTRRSLWELLWIPSWAPCDSRAVLWWLLAVPAALASVVTILAVTGTLTGAEILVGGLVAFAVWIASLGAMVRPGGRWREVPVLALALTSVLCLIYVLAMGAQDNGRNASDTAASIGVMLLAPLSFILFTVLVLAGKASKALVGLTSRGLRRPRRDY